MGVSPASTAKVTAADMSASATASEPITRDDSFGAEALASPIATSSALAIGMSPAEKAKRKAGPQLRHAPLPRVNLMHLYNNVAGMRQPCGVRVSRIRPEVSRLRDHKPSP